MNRLLQRISALKKENTNFRLPDVEVGWSYENHFAQAAELYNPIANSFWYYQWMIDELLKIDNLALIPLRDLMASSETTKRIIALRHDIDMDPETGLRCARYLARKGVGGSFYLLHTNPYYGNFYGGHFVRNPILTDWVKSFIVTGCELGLHNDCMQIYKTHNFDGAAIIQQEIAWLRSVGAVIKGTVAHASGPFYGAENYEIFRGRKLWNRKVLSSKSLPIPLGILSEDDLGLTYEGTFAQPRKHIDLKSVKTFFSDTASANVRSKEWMMQFIFNNPVTEYLTDCQFWLLGKDFWVVAGRVGDKRIFEWEIKLKCVLEIVADLPPGSRSIFVLHPVYVRKN